MLRAKDYIAAPKKNGYRSLHLTADGGAGADGAGGERGDAVSARSVFEVQIRTAEMDRDASSGRCAHYLYNAAKAEAEAEAEAEATAAAKATAALHDEPAFVWVRSALQDHWLRNDALGAGGGAEPAPATPATTRPSSPTSAAWRRRPVANAPSHGIIYGSFTAAAAAEDDRWLGRQLH